MGIISGVRFAASLAFLSALSFSFMPAWLGTQHNSTLILFSWNLCNRWWIQRITGWWLLEYSDSMALLESVNITNFIYIFYSSSTFPLLLHLLLHLLSSTFRIFTCFIPAHFYIVVMKHEQLSTLQIRLPSYLLFTLLLYFLFILYLTRSNP